MDMNHLHLAVADVEKSRKFYERCFGFREKIWHGNILFLTSDDGFDLALDPKYPPSPMPPWYHHGFRLESENAVKQVFAGMQASFPEQIKRPVETYPDHVFFKCVDIDGYAIEVYWEPQP